MNIYTFETKVKSVAGTQQWTVEANDEKEAFKKFEDGDCELEYESMEVTSIGKPTLIEVESMQQDSE